MTIYATAISRALDFARRPDESSRNLSQETVFTEIIQEIQLNFNPSYLYDIFSFFFFFRERNNRLFQFGQLGIRHARSNFYSDVIY